MTRRAKLLQKILSGRSDTEIALTELLGLLESLGFRRRKRGSHNIFTRKNVQERIYLQSEGAKAKRYQVKQIRNILTKYGIGEDDDE